MKCNVSGYVDLTIFKGFVNLTVDIIYPEECEVDSIEQMVDVAPRTGTVRAGEDLLKGDAVYIDPMERAFKASATKKCGGDESYKSNVDGFVASDSPVGVIVPIIHEGAVFPQIDGPLVVGKCVYLSTSPGKVSSRLPTDVGTFRLKLGTARRSDELAISIDKPIFNS